MSKQGKILKIEQRGKDDSNWLAEFLATNPEPWIVTFSPPSTMDAALRDEDLMQLCTMEATSYQDDGRTIIFMNENGTTCMGFEKIRLNFEKKINGKGCKAIAFYYAKAAEPDLDKEGLDWPCWILTVSTVKKCY